MNEISSVCSYFLKSFVQPLFNTFPIGVRKTVTIWDLLELGFFTKVYAISYYLIFSTFCILRIQLSSNLSCLQWVIEYANTIGALLS